MSALSRVRLLIASTTRRTLSTKAKFNVLLDPSTAHSLQHDNIKHRKHAGMDRTVGAVSIDADRTEAIGRALGEHPPKQVWNDSLVLTRYLRARHAPAEQADIEQRRTQYEREVRDSQPQRDEPPDAVELKRFEQRVQKLMQQRTYSWKPIEYDSYRALQYLLGRAPAEYAALVRIFGEIAQRRPDFRAQSFFDFGSGVGTGTWAAARLWHQSIFEYYLVDASRDMNDLADLLLRGGDENRALELRNVNFRQFLPAAADSKYDLVLSAFSLLELPDARTRLQTLRTLWAKCDRFLVIVEQGTRAGFNVVNEARDYLLYSSEADSCSVFAPCPHSQACPRHADANDRTPCNFLAAYTQLPFASGGAAAAKLVRYEPFSYVVLEKKQGQSNVDDDAAIAEDAWPRLVRPTLVRAKHSICRMCTAGGRLEEIIFTQSRHGKDAYRCARASRWGDRLPVQLEEKAQTTTTVEEEEATASEEESKS